MTLQLPGGIDIQEAQRAHQAHRMRVDILRDQTAVQIFSRLIADQPGMPLEAVKECARLAAHASMYLPEAMGLCKINEQEANDRGAETH